jgi:hypothetical protein
MKMALSFLMTMMAILILLKWMMTITMNVLTTLGIKGVIKIYTLSHVGNTGISMTTILTSDKLH